MKYSVDYSVYSDPDGELLDQNPPDYPLEFEAGANEVISGFELGVCGMVAGETKEFFVDPEDGYGLRDEDLIKMIDVKELPQDVDFEVGEFYAIGECEDETVTFQVTGRQGDDLVCDFNHPLAGRRLKFVVKVVSTD
jgi:peptidylprolyl isomerase